MWMIDQFGGRRPKPGTLVLVTREYHAVHAVPVIGPRIAAWLTRHYASTPHRYHLVGPWYLVRYLRHGSLRGPNAPPLPPMLQPGRDPRLSRLDEWRRDNL
jgi:hypothetical protein